MPETPGPLSTEGKAMFDSLAKLSSDVVTGLWTKSPEALTFFASELIKFAKEPISGMTEQSWRGFLNFYKSIDLLDEDDIQNILKLRQFGEPMNFVFYLGVFIRLFGTFINSTTEPASLKLQQGINKKLRPQLPYVAEIIEAAFVAPEKTGEVREILARSGYSEDAIDMLFLSKYRRYEEFQVQALFLRKDISSDKMYERMRELGYTDTRIDELKKLWTIIPPVQDILTMVAKEAFEPDSVALMGLEDEFPASQAEWLTKQGLSPFWQMKYWAAHWDQPSIQQGFEMLHRGVISHGELDFLFKTVELPPYWRDKLTKIAYLPYTRVDTRRMYDVGVLDDDDLHKSYTDLGYDDEHADKMSEFTRRWVEDPERDLTKGEILKGYRNRLLTRTDAVALMGDLRYSEAQANYFCELEDFREIQEQQNAAIKAVETRYKNALIDRAEAQRLLEALNVPSATVALWFERWDVTLIEYPKLASRTDLDKFYIADVINADIYHIEMKRLGYGTTYIGWYKTMADKIKGRSAPS